MSTKLFRKKISLPIYETSINLFVVPTIDHMQAYLDKKANALVDVTNSYGCVFDLNGPKGIEYYIVYVEDKLSTNLISHEIYHLATRILKDINIEDEESTAWLVGHLTEKIYRVLRQKNYNIKE
jgi:hypothetical protein